MTVTLTRRHILAGAIAAPAVLSLPRGASAQTVMTLGHNAAPTNPRHVAALKFAELLKASSGGRLEVRVSPSEQLGNEQSLLTSLRTGAVDMTVNSQGSTSSLVPEIAALGLPFLFKTSAEAFKLLDGSFGEVMLPRFARVNMVPLGWWDNGIRHITNSKRPINVPDDLKGLKIRTPPDPMTIDIFQALGAATQQISFGELYVALQQGVVDGQENPLANIASSKIFEVNRFISLTAHKWECTPFLISQITWARLSTADKDLVKAAAAEAGKLQRGLMNDADVKFLAEFKANSALSVNQADQEAFRKASAKVADEWRKKPFGDFVDQLVKAAAV
jgi:tripartite ATP-independent transporter DctP family solute receptor